MLTCGVICPAWLRHQPALDGQWTSVFTWGTGGGVEAVHTFLLPNGKVMFWSTWRESVGLWNPTTQQFSVAGNLPAFNPFCSGHAWLPDGRLLVAGGHISNYNGENRADIYDPFTNLWVNANPSASDVPNMGSTSSNNATSGKRWYPSATTLGNGDVLVMSGDVVSQGVTNRTVQVYEHATNAWRTLTGALRPSNDLLPEYPRVFSGPDGRAVSLTDTSNDTEFLNLSGTGSWTYLQDTLDPNLANYGPAVMYDTGKIAYVGGGHSPTRNVSMLDLNVASPAWRYAGGGTTPPPIGSPYVMAQPRRQNNATILADGTVLITGGTRVTGWNDPSGLVSTAEIWNPVTEQVDQVAQANVNIYRGYHSTALLLPDGRVLVTGGDHDYGGAIPGQNTNAEIYSPAYLFAQMARPRSGRPSRPHPMSLSLATRSLCRHPMRPAFRRRCGSCPGQSPTPTTGPSEQISWTSPSSMAGSTSICRIMVTRPRPATTCCSSSTTTGCLRWPSGCELSSPV